ncbi:hypothetical protein CBER1_01686 [Cercospora berteroae]|uniref:Uncharacterized protein n=1 Tax=Cercospora berteroae TaxID=357750 RepID=A0A2S6CHA3_9PEZI|nr:hypothetical protein CBER1_01686 [Cercospora berteroae]
MLDMKEKPRRNIDEAIASFVAADLKMWDQFLFGDAERAPNARLRIAHISKLDPYPGACDEPGVRRVIKRPINACHPLKYREALMDHAMAKMVQSQAYLDFFGNLQESSTGSAVKIKASNGRGISGLSPAERRIITSNIERVAAGLQYTNDDLNQEAADLVLEESFYLIPVILRSRCRNNVAGWKALVAEIVG